MLQIGLVIDTVSPFHTQGTFVGSNGVHYPPPLPLLGVPELEYPPYKLYPNVTTHTHTGGREDQSWLMTSVPIRSQSPLSPHRQRHGLRLCGEVLVLAAPGCYRCLRAGQSRRALVRSFIHSFTQSFNKATGPGRGVIQRGKETKSLGWRTQLYSQMPCSQVLCQAAEWAAGR